eukprot:CAMPEP_0179630778 /NCGR_PEP_ID=MMETSP0932-20121108/6073_1 /TAXON_ID=548131 ORGANISM="Ostreococcus mediterraneus, Strain clade-D-RCC2596" /NCGR_SAMPLE_ID=MMETSP0932 /ASSEMBLY_ACC=CAM_ASM_000582 /LENGTH=125 /DNA_ID=CAMNT_0021500249 /DNA_START=98 /DNA_END=471 /DNA_ORIENTATION=-
MARVSQAPQYLGSAAARTSRHAHREVSVPLAGRQAVIVNLFNKNKEPDWDGMENKKRTVSDEIGRRQFANRRANNGKDRKDLYTDNWDGSEYKGSSFNILSVVAGLFVLVPVGLLAFAYTSYGTL